MIALFAGTDEISPPTEREALGACVTSKGLMA